MGKMGSLSLQKVLFSEDESNDTQANAKKNKNKMEELSTFSDNAGQRFVYNVELTLIIFIPKRLAFLPIKPIARSSPLVKDFQLCYTFAFILLMIVSLIVYTT
uniref:Uncharacterized protein n=1 Tax=Glossina austeni TaxID=7395 RepID=A0A1A9VAZ1_GLOAU